MPRGLLQLAVEDDDVSNNNNSTTPQQQQSNDDGKNNNNKAMMNSSLTVDVDSLGNNSKNTSSPVVVDTVLFGGSSHNNNNASSASSGGVGGRKVGGGPDIPAQVQRLLQVNKPFTLPGVASYLKNQYHQQQNNNNNNLYSSGLATTTGQTFSHGGGRGAFASSSASAAGGISSHQYVNNSNNNNRSGPNSANANRPLDPQTPRSIGRKGSTLMPSNLSFGGGVGGGRLAGVPSYNILSAPGGVNNTTTNNNQNNNNNPSNNLMNINTASAEELAALFEEIQYVRIRTSHVAIIASLHDGLDPRTIMMAMNDNGAGGSGGNSNQPNISQRERTAHTARLECWRDPLEFDTASSGGTGTMASGVAQALADQYRSISGQHQQSNSCLFHYFADATDHDIEKGLMGVRRRADEGRSTLDAQSRIVVHYNGHGMITSPEGDLFFPNVTNTHFVPMSLSHFSNCVGSPALYVFDCDRAGGFVKYFERNLASHPKHARDIILCACSANEELPRNPGYPMDLFTSCLTTPLRTLLLWSGHNNAMLGHISATAGASGDSDDDEELQNYYSNLGKGGEGNNTIDGGMMIGADGNIITDGSSMANNNGNNNNNNINTDDLVFGTNSSSNNNSYIGGGGTNTNKRPLLERPFIDIPGSTSDRKTPLGELQLILTALIDMIAWCCVSPEKFYQYFRGDTLTRHLVRNFLLADRIMREFGRRPVSYPPIAPEARQHPLWAIWEVVLDGVLSQMPMIQHDPSKYRNSSFFPDQLTAFATWLEVGDVMETNAEQLPCVMFALQKPSHYRDRALLLLGKYFETGKTAVFRGLACGALQYLPLFAKSSGYQPNLLLLNAWHQLLRVLPRIFLDENEQRLLLSILRLTPEDCRLQIVQTDGAHHQYNINENSPVVGERNDSSSVSGQSLPLSPPSAMMNRGLNNNQQLRNLPSLFPSSNNNSRNPHQNNSRMNQNTSGNNTNNRGNNNNQSNNNNNSNNDEPNQQKPKVIRTVLTSASLSLTKGRTHAAHMLCTLLGYGKMNDEDLRLVDISNSSASAYVPGGNKNDNNNNNNTLGGGSPKNSNNNNNSSTSFLSVPDVNNEATAHGFWAMRLFSTAYPLLRHEEEEMRSWACLLIGCLLAYLPAAREKLAARLFENSSDELFFSLLQDTSPSVRASCVFLLTKLIGSRLENLDHDALQRRVFLERLILQRLFDSFSEVSRLVRREILFAAASVLFHYGSLLPELLTNTNERGPDAVKPEWKSIPNDQFRRIAFSLVPADSPIRLPPSSGRSTVASHLTASGERAPITDIDKESLVQSPTVVGNNSGGGSNSNTNSSGANFPSNAQMPRMMMNHVSHGNLAGMNNNNANNNNNNNASSNNYGNYQTPSSNLNSNNHQDQNLQNSRESMHSCLSEILLRDLKDVVWDAAVLLARARASSDPLISELSSRVTSRLTSEQGWRVLPRSARARLAGLALLESTAADAAVANSEAVRHRNRRNEDLARLALFHAEETGTAFANSVNPATIAAAVTLQQQQQQQRNAIASGKTPSQPHSPNNNNNSPNFPPSSVTTASTSSPGSPNAGDKRWGIDTSGGATAASALGLNTSVEVATFNSFSSTCGLNSIRTGTFRLLEPHVFLADHSNKLHVIDYDRLDEPQKLFHMQLPTPVHSLHLVNDLSPSVSCILVSANGVVSMYGGFFSTSGTFTPSGQPTPWQVGPLLSFNSATAFREHDTGYTQWSGLARRNDYLPSSFRQRDGLFAISPVLNKIQCVSLQEEKTSQILHLSCDSQCSVIATDPVISSTTSGGSGGGAGGGGGSQYYQNQNFNQKLYCGFADGTVRLYDQRQPVSGGGGSLALMCVVDSTSSFASSKQGNATTTGNNRHPKTSFNTPDPFAIRHISVMNSNENLIMTSSCQGGLKIWDLRKRACVVQMYDTPSFVTPEAPKVPSMMSNTSSSSSKQQKNGGGASNTIATGSLVNAALSQKQDVVCSLRGNGAVELVRLDASAALANTGSMMSSSSNSSSSTLPPFSLLGSATASETGMSALMKSQSHNYLKTAIVAHPLKPFFAIGSSIVSATNSKQRLKVTTMSM